MVNSMVNSAHPYKDKVDFGWIADLFDNKIDVANKFAADWELNYNTSKLSIKNGMAIATLVSASDTSAALALIGIADSHRVLI